MKVFTADEARARIAEYEAGVKRKTQREAEEICETAFNEIREKSARGGQYITLSVCDFKVCDQVMKILKDAGYEITNDFSRIWVKWG